MTVDFDNFLDGAGLEECGGYALLYAKDDALAGRDLCGFSSMGVWCGTVQGTEAYSDCC